ncbi:MAG: DUF3524 domain-containing protein [Acidimicrobiales bacterium]|nr:DUF3524 domain-containing protein [Acidimicrobiales bacterium]
MANVLILEPWYRGSHRSWVEGWRSKSKHSISVVNGSDSGWRRSLITSPSIFAAEIDNACGDVDVLVASTPIDLATVFGLLHRSTPRPPTLLYMHESQIGYPPGPKGGRAYRAIVADWGSILSADRIAVASRFHAELLISELPGFIEELARGAGSRVEAALSNMQILPVGIETSGMHPKSVDGKLKILWNHRWSHDKRPGDFVHAMAKLAAEGLDFEIFALGEVERSGAKSHQRLKSQLADRLACFGVQSKSDYQEILCRADLVVSTAQHDFFGVAVAEAILAGARPVLPWRLAYPELVPTSLHSELLYKGSLHDALRLLLASDRDRLHVHRAATRGHVAEFGWRNLAPKYDVIVDEMVSAAQ